MTEDEKLINPTPSDRASTRATAAAILEAVRADESVAKAAGLMYRDGYDKDGVEALLVAMAQEIEALAKERNEACDLAAWWMDNNDANHGERIDAVVCSDDRRKLAALRSKP